MYMFLSQLHRVIQYLTLQSSLKTVSYTHLDVYKRQTQAAVEKGYLDSDEYTEIISVVGDKSYKLVDPLKSVYTGLVPVSYTHLDVYKRQVRHRLSYQAVADRQLLK